MSLPIINIRIGDVVNVLWAGRPPAQPWGLELICTTTLINKYGLHPSYVDGNNPDDRLNEINSTPYRLGNFRGYDHNADPPSPQIDVWLDLAYLDATGRGDYLLGDIYLRDGNGVILDGISLNQVTSASAEWQDIGTDWYIDTSDVQIYDGGIMITGFRRWNIDGGAWNSGSITSVFEESGDVVFEFYKEEPTR